MLPNYRTPTDLQKPNDEHHAGPQENIMARPRAYLPATHEPQYVQAEPDMTWEVAGEAAMGTGAVNSAADLNWLEAGDKRVRQNNDHTLRS